MKKGAAVCTRAHPRAKDARHFTHIVGEVVIDIREVERGSRLGQRDRVHVSGNFLETAQDLDLRMGGRSAVLAGQSATQRHDRGLCGAAKVRGDDHGGGASRVA
jgi:hypothetical protein